MKPLTDAELIMISGGWDWGDFFGGVALGIGLAGSIYTGNVMGVVACSSSMLAMLD
jgi:hypothetical protein